MKARFQLPDTTYRFHATNQPSCRPFGSRQVVRIAKPEENIAYAADGARIDAGDRVLVEAEVLGAAGPLNALDKTGVVALLLQSYTTGAHKVCVPPEKVKTVLKRAPPP